uniref:3-dehydroquinate synthase n=1 Tax=Prasinoderma coloniale TaxID=156133 RepID=A0A7R9T8S7_9VIRI|eukprot:PRCOL_00000314-RA
MAAAAAQKRGELVATVDVDLGDRSYPIYIGTGLLDNAELLQRHVRGDRALVVSNETVAPLYLERCAAALSEGSGTQVDAVAFPDGEEHKDLATLMMAWDKAMECRLGRDATFVALGGGVVGDMTGFAASAYQRGVDFVQVPTTLMAMVDSSVGGKTGVNHPLGKNMIGAFYQPQCVLIDTETLASLPQRELASGVAEVVKYGLIWDAELFVWLEENVDAILAKDAAALAHVVKRSCEIKAAIVAEDEKEAGLRATLNLGHTFGHAVETGVGYGEWLHGEAVSAGMCMAAKMSADMGWCDASIFERTEALLRRIGTPVDVSGTGMTKDEFIKYMSVDKKNKGGQIRLILLKGELGKCVFTGDYPREALEDVLEHYCASN